MPKIFYKETVTTCRFGAKNTKLTVNVKKTKSMIFGTAKRIRSLSNLDLKMQNMSLSQVTSYKYLGVVQCMQNRALRCILGPPFIRASSNVLHNKLNLSTLEVRRHQHLANVMLKRSKQIEYHDIKDRRTTIQDNIILKVQHPEIEQTKNAICFKGSVL